MRHGKGPLTIIETVAGRSLHAAAWLGIVSSSSNKLTFVQFTSVAVGDLGSLVRNVWTGKLGETS